MNVVYFKQLNHGNKLIRYDCFSNHKFSIKIIKNKIVLRFTFCIIISLIINI